MASSTRRGWSTRGWGRQVFKKRGAPPQRHGTHQAKPKHLTFLLDASASMARGDALDGRLHRMASTAALLIEALHGFEHKFVYNMSMHSGGTADAPLLEAGRSARVTGLTDASYVIATITRGE